MYNRITFTAYFIGGNNMNWNIFFILPIIELVILFILKLQHINSGFWMPSFIVTNGTLAFIWCKHFCPKLFQDFRKRKVSPLGELTNISTQLKYIATETKKNLLNHHEKNLLVHWKYLTKEEEQKPCRESGRSYWNLDRHSYNKRITIGFLLHFIQELRISVLLYNSHLFVFAKTLKIYTTKIILLCLMTWRQILQFLKPYLQLF